MCNSVCLLGEKSLCVVADVGSLLHGTKSSGKVCKAGGTGLRSSGLLQWALPSCEWEFPAQEFAQGSAPWLSSSSSPPRGALHL